MEMHPASVWEAITDVVGDAPAVTHGSTQRTWTEYDDRAARLAATFVEEGLAPDSKIAIFLYNSNEYLETQYAAFKMRGVPINVNYRYLDEELYYLLENADAEALVFHSSLADRVSRIVHRLPKLRLLIEVDDLSQGGDSDSGKGVAAAHKYEEVVAGHQPMPRIDRNVDDIYMLYTGGTTGMPKGVMYSVGALTESFIRGGYPLAGLSIPASASEIAPAIKALHAADNAQISIPGCPLMHGTGMWLGAMFVHFAGGSVISLEQRSFDAHEMFQVAQQKRATNLVVVGDSFVKPMIRALDEAAAAGRAYDTSHVKLIISSGVMWTNEVKEHLLERIEQAILLDAMGSTEGGMGTSISMKGATSATAKFVQNPTTKVFAEDGREVQPGSGEIGLVAAGGSVPLGYYKDPEKSARTFRVIDGKRYSFPGDMAMIAEDGSLILLGRGSQVINSGGEKIFPEEVEEAVKRISGVLDCLVVGIADEKFGQAVTAVVSLTHDGASDAAAIKAGVRGGLAGYKTPKRVVFVSKIPRAANGKADYDEAKRLALAAP
ncbi:MAG: AMP-binding protein [Ilumatobacteraceae bacterium]